MEIGIKIADLVRSGDLDFYLLQPIDEQFLITCRSIEWSTAPNVLMGAVVMVIVRVVMHMVVIVMNLQGMRRMAVRGMRMAGMRMAGVRVAAV